MNLFSLISGWLQRRDEEPKLNSQFFLTLRSNYIGLKPENPDKVQQETMARIDELFCGVENWSSAYAIEQLLILLYQSENLNIEMQRRLVEAKRMLHPDEFAKYQELIRETTDMQSRRILLSRLVNDIQWRHTINETKRKYMRITSARTGILFGVSVIMFAIVYLMVVYVPTYLDLHAGGLVAAASGFLGASFSMILGQRKRLEATSFDDLKVMRRFGYSIPRALVGLGAATILYYMMVCGLIGGLAFPDLTNSVANQNGPGFSSISRGSIYSATGLIMDPANTELSKAVDSFVSNMENILSTRNVIPDTVLETESRNIAAIAVQAGAKDSIDTLTDNIFVNLKSLFENTLGPTDVALLIVWCFLAGFSEQLVPKLLTTTENKINSGDSRSVEGNGEIPPEYEPSISSTEASGQPAGAEAHGDRAEPVAGENAGKNAPDSPNSPAVPTKTAQSGSIKSPSDREATQPITPVMDPGNP